MKDDGPLISIITPNYNYAGYIGETIESTLGQDYQNIEHIVVDDGSTDDSVQVIQKLADAHPGRVRLIAQENTGQSGAVNRGLREASGEILGWINSDDTYCSSQSIGRIAEAFQENPDTEIIYGDYKVINGEGKVVQHVKELNMDQTMGALLGYMAVSTSHCIFWKAALMEEVGFLKEDFKYNMDGEFFARLFPGRTIRHIPVYIANWRFHEACKTQETISTKASERFQFEKDFELMRSYEQLPVSRMVPYSWAAPLRSAYRVKRIACRLLKGHYNDRITGFFKRKKAETNA